MRTGMAPQKALPRSAPAEPLHAVSEKVTELSKVRSRHSNPVVQDTIGSPAQAAYHAYRSVAGTFPM